MARRARIPRIGKGIDRLMPAAAALEVGRVGWPRGKHLQPLHIVQFAFGNLADAADRVVEAKPCAPSSGRKGDCDLRDERRDER